MKTVRAHLQEHLGPAAARHSIVGTSWGVLQFNDVPGEGCTTFVTDGVSGLVVRQPNQRPIRQELLMTASSSDVRPEAIVRALTEVARHSERREALLRGSVHRFEEKIGGMSDYYVSHPAYHPPEIEVLPVEGEGFVAWVLPILPEESAFIARAGWRAFDALLEATQVDLTDLNRTSILEDEKLEGAICIVSPLVAAGAPVLQALRDPPDHSLDSGWRFFAKTEEEEHLAPSAARFLGLADFRDTDERLAAILGAPVGAAFERETDADEFMRVTDAGRALH